MIQRDLNCGHFEVDQNRGKISKTKEATPTKFGLHVFHIILYLHEFFEPILFFNPHEL